VSCHSHPILMEHLFRNPGIIVTHLVRTCKLQANSLLYLVPMYDKQLVGTNAACHLIEVFTQIYEGHPDLTVLIGRGNITFWRRTWISDVYVGWGF
jgi:hypothetical protein